MVHINGEISNREMIAPQEFEHSSRLKRRRVPPRPAHRHPDIHPKFPQKPHKFAAKAT